MVTDACTCLYFEYKEPIAQPIVPVISTKKLINLSLSPEKSVVPFPANNSSTPANPVTKPRIISLFEKLNFHCLLSSNTNQRGTVATTMAARPVGRYCSAQVTAPLPINNIRIPPKPIVPNNLNDGALSPFIKHQI